MCITYELDCKNTGTNLISSNSIFEEKLILFFGWFLNILLAVFKKVFYNIIFSSQLTTLK